MSAVHAGMRKATEHAELIPHLGEHFEVRRERVVAASARRKEVLRQHAEIVRDDQHALRRRRLRSSREHGCHAFEHRKPERDAKAAQEGAARQGGGGGGDVHGDTEMGGVTGGRKFDGNKLEYGLLPPLALRAVVEILTIGAQKYERDNWKFVPDGKRRYFDAGMRHLWDSKCGQKYDEETNKSHLAHAICNLMFLLEKELLTE